MSTITTATPQTGETGQATQGTQSGSTPATQSASGVVQFTPEQQAHIDNIIKERLARQKDTMEGQATAARERAEREAAETKAREQGEYQKLAESEKARADKAEADRVALEARTRDRITKTEVRAAAVGLNAVDPDDVYALLDKSKVEYSDDGEPTNIAALVKTLLEAKPHLVAGASSGGTMPIPRTPNGSTLTADQVKAQERERLIRSGKYAAM